MVVFEHSTKVTVQGSEFEMLLSFAMKRIN